MIIIFWFIAIIFEIASKSATVGSGFAFSIISAMLIGCALLDRRNDLLIWASAILVVNIITRDPLWEIIPSILIALFLTFTHNRFWNGQSSLINGLLYTGLLITNSLLILTLEKSISFGVIVPTVIANIVMAIGSTSIYWFATNREKKDEVT